MSVGTRPVSDRVAGEVFASTGTGETRPAISSSDQGVQWLAAIRLPKCPRTLSSKPSSPVEWLQSEPTFLASDKAKPVRPQFLEELHVFVVLDSNREILEPHGRSNALEACGPNRIDQNPSPG
jgi:hypothetical protein